MMPESLSPPGTEIVSPYLQRRGRYKPKIDDLITVELPGERTRAKVRGITSDDIVLVELLSVPVSKQGHSFLKGGLYPAKRSLGDHDLEVWKAISEFELQQQEAQARFQAEQAERERLAEADRIAEVRARDLAAQAEAEIPRGIEPAPRPVLGPRRNRVSRSV